MPVNQELRMAECIDETLDNFDHKVELAQRLKRDNAVRLDYIPNTSFPLSE